MLHSCSLQCLGADKPATWQLKCQQREVSKGAGKGAAAPSGEPALEAMQSSKQQRQGKTALLSLSSSLPHLLRPQPPLPLGRLGQGCTRASAVSGEEHPSLSEQASSTASVIRLRQGSAPAVAKVATSVGRLDFHSALCAPASFDRERFFGAALSPPGCQLMPLSQIQRP